MVGNYADGFRPRRVSFKRSCVTVCGYVCEFISRVRSRIRYEPRTKGRTERRSFTRPPTSVTVRIEVDAPDRDAGSAPASVNATHVAGWICLQVKRDEVFFPGKVPSARRLSASDSARPPIPEAPKGVLLRNAGHAHQYALGFLDNLPFRQRLLQVLGFSTNAWISPNRRIARTAMAG